MFRLIRFRIRGGAPSTFLPISTTKSVLLNQVNDHGIHHSCIQWRGRSNAAPLPSDMENSQAQAQAQTSPPTTTTRRKRVPRAQRRAMVESYVNQYRETHEGKFPTVSDALKQVGGSYYVLRNILQELKHNSKSCSSNGRKEIILGAKFSEERELLTEVGKLSTGGANVDAGTQCDSQPAAVVDVVVDDTREVVEETQTSETMSPKEEGDCKGISHPCPSLSESGTVRTQNGDFNSLEREISEDCQQTHTAFEDLMDNDRPKHKQGTRELDRHSRSSNDVEPQKRSTLWGNLKSLADTIVNIWWK